MILRGNLATYGVIDRRRNPGGKSLANRQRFLRRARAQIKKIVNESVRERNIADVDSKKEISIPAKGIGEPHFHHAPHGGVRNIVLKGNKKHFRGERIPKPEGGGGGGRGKQGADHGEGMDDFVFTLSREEFLSIFFEDLELPDLVKTSLRELVELRPRKAGIAKTGTPSNLDALRTLKQSYARHRALKRPRQEAVAELEEQIAELEKKSPRTDEEEALLERLCAELAALKERRERVPFIEPSHDLRFRRFSREHHPTTNAVMFCLMDVSGSMGEREKDLAKRFFVLLHLFLKRRYERVDVVFIRHTHEAQEVDEQTFFHDPETGGTVVSTALSEMLRVVKERYSPADWNIFAAEASDGENFSNDGPACAELMREHILPLCQYFAYVEIVDEDAESAVSPGDGSPLWETYRPISGEFSRLAMKRIGKPADIYPVFRELFQKRGGGKRDA